MDSPTADLRSFRLDDLATVVRWSRDDDFCRANGWTIGRDEAEVMQHWTSLITAPPDDLVRLAAEVDGLLVGYADLADVRDGEAELGFAIGDSSTWGRGLGSAVAHAVVTFGFTVLGLRRIPATVHEPNLRSQKVLTRLGFRQAGVLDDRDDYMGELVSVTEFVLER